MIEIKNLSKKYDNTVIFNQADYTFPKKGIVCIMGASGSGKSMFLNLLAGFDLDYDGIITVEDTNLNTLKKEELCIYRKKYIGFIFQEYHLLSGYTVLENILMASNPDNKDFNEDKSKAIKLLENMGLIDKQNQKVENLSGGQKQRVAIIRALIGNPSIILADEPTGALDRSNSTEIMNILKEISKDTLVIVITHDEKVCSFADEIISIEEGKIVTNINQKEKEPCETISFTSTDKVNVWKKAIKSFKINVKRYFTVALAISIGIFCFILSLSFNNVIDKSINEFKEKNTAFNNGYIKVEKDNIEDIEKILGTDKRINNVYRQYKIEGIVLNLGNKKEVLDEKYPIPKANKNMSYGVMPKINHNQIVISPSLAKKFSKNINQLIGKELVINCNGTNYSLIISGIFNADFDDFIVSSDIEKLFYQNNKDKKVISVSYDTTNFEDVVTINKMLKDNKFHPEDASSQVLQFQNTFQTINKLFLVVSTLILIICLFISVILLTKLQRSRYKEVGLLSALGFNHRNIRNIIVIESVLLSITAFMFNGLWLILCSIICKISNLPIKLTTVQIIFSLLLTFIVIEVICVVTSCKLVRIDPAIALRE